MLLNRGYNILHHLVLRLEDLHPSNARFFLRNSQLEIVGRGDCLSLGAECAQND